MGLTDKLFKRFKTGAIDEALKTGAWVHRAQELGMLTPQQPTPRSMFFDPMSLVAQVGYKEKTASLSYDILYQMATRTEVVNAIINTRLAQIGAFCQPARWKNKTGLGFEIRFKDPKKKPNKEESTRLGQLEDIIYNCGYVDAFRSGERRPNFGEFVRRILRDSLTYDQTCFEIVPNRAGEPCEWWPVDAATIRIAQPSLQNFGTAQDGRDIVKYVQIYNGVVRHKFSYREMAFCTRNQDSNIKKNGYGLSELEQLINMITAILWAEEYNKRFFSQGQMINGILNLKGQNIAPEMMEAFRRQWQALAANVTNAHKVPLLTVKDGVEFINFHSTNRDMEYQAWMEFLVKIITAVYLIDPAEINYDYRGASDSAPLFETSPEAKLKHSRDKGLRNLLNWLEEKINYHIINEFRGMCGFDGRDLYFEFVGIDMKDEQEIVNIRASEAQSYKKVNEIREEAGLPALKPQEGGDLILNPVLINWMLQQQQIEMQQQMAAQGGGQDQKAPQGDPNKAITHSASNAGGSPFVSAPGGGGKPPAAAPPMKGGE